MGTIIKYQLILKEDICELHRQIVAKMLEEQQKVKAPYDGKADRCKFICIVTDNEIPIAIGAIKKKTKKDFNTAKGNLAEYADKFEWELGYMYVKREYEGQGIATTIVKELLTQFGEGNLMASTEITENPGMVKVLKKFGFSHYGKTWKSVKHENDLGLFLKFRSK